MIQDLSKQLPIRARVAVALAICDKLCAILPIDGTDGALVAKSLDSAWRWVEGSSIRAIDLHSLASESDLRAQKMTDPKQVSVFVAVGTALSYECWHAFAVDVEAGICNSNDVPGEMYDIDEGAIALVEHAALSTGLITEAWVNSLVATAVSKFANSDHNSLGAPIRRSLFQ